MTTRAIRLSADLGGPEPLTVWYYLLDANDVTRDQLSQAGLDLSSLDGQRAGDWSSRLTSVLKRLQQPEWVVTGGKAHHATLNFVLELRDASVAYPNTVINQKL